jgi:hypothetical protein
MAPTSSRKTPRLLLLPRTTHPSSEIHERHADDSRHHERLDFLTRCEGQQSRGEQGAVDVIPRESIHEPATYDHISEYPPRPYGTEASTGRSLTDRARTCELLSCYTRTERASELNLAIPDKTMLPQRHTQGEAPPRRHSACLAELPTKKRGCPHLAEISLRRYIDPDI